MGAKHDLELMKRKWTSLNIEKYFTKVHHFSSEKFATKPSGLNVFFNWCVQREIMEENLQTLHRALTAASLFEQGRSIEQAIDSAWKQYPVCKR